MKAVLREVKAEELKRDADRNDMKYFYTGLKEVWGIRKKLSVHMKSTIGTRNFFDNKRVVAIRKEYLQKLLKVSDDIEEETLEISISALTTHVSMIYQP